MSKPMPVISKRVTVSDITDNTETKTFVRLTTKDVWLIWATTGEKRIKATVFGRTSLLTTLHDTVEMACNGELESCTAGDAHHGNGDGADTSVSADPMDMIDVDASPPSKRRKVQSRSRDNARNRYFASMVKSTIFYTLMPEKPFEEDA